MRIDTGVPLKTVNPCFPGKTGFDVVLTKFWSSFNSPEGLFGVSDKETPLKQLASIIRLIGSYKIGPIKLNWFSSMRTMKLENPLVVIVFR